MSRDVVSPKLFEKVVSHRLVREMNKQSVRNAISRIHKENPGITMNAAASIFADNKGFGVYGYLSSQDKQSLQHRKSTPAPEPSSNGPRARKVVVQDAKVDFESAFTSEANANAKAYPHIYILENALRSAILKEFERDTDWWKNRSIVKREIQEYAERIREAEKKYPWMKERGSHPIYYVGLFELFKIIEKNWKPHFEQVFNDFDQLRAWIKESVPIRNYVAHNISTRPQERELIKKNTDYICRLIEKWEKRSASSTPW